MVAPRQADGAQPEHDRDGEIANLKSTLIKTFLCRQCVFGRQFWILDVKGEYGPFAEALGYPDDQA